MKKIISIFFFTLFGICLNAQSPFRIKVIDAQTSDNIAKAIVFIEEIPLPDQETDANGIVVFQNVPEDRKVRVNVRKKGYIPNQTEIVANRAIKVDNNIVIKLGKEPTTPQVIVYGEVTNNEGDEVEGATVEVNILGKPFSTLTDNGGNYQIRIDGNLFKSIASFKIEAKKSDCERFKTTENVPKSDVINKDIVLKCKEAQPPLPPSLAKFTQGDWIFEVTSCTQSGNRVECKVRITSLGKDHDLNPNWIPKRIISSTGNEYQLTEIKLGDKINQEKSFVADVPVNCIFVANNVNETIDFVAKLEVYFTIDNYSSQTVIPVFRNIKVGK